MQRLLLTILGCLVLVVAGCGDDSSSTTESVRERAAALAEKYEAEEEAEAEKAAEEKAEAEKAAVEETEESEKAAAELPEVTVPKGPPPKKLVVEDLKQGSGATAKAGDQVSVEYIGVLYDDGEIFEANWGKEAEPLGFELGAGEVIKGWDKGVQGMRVGGERKLIIPSELAYGEQAIYPSIPANADLVFLVKLLAVK